jgi:hypothetical protein
LNAANAQVLDVIPPSHLPTVAKNQDAATVTSEYRFARQWLTAFNWRAIVVVFGDLQKEVFLSPGPIEGTKSAWKEFHISNVQKLSPVWDWDSKGQTDRLRHVDLKVAWLGNLSLEFLE